MFIEHPGPNSPHERYRRDPVFRQLVDTLYLQIEAANYTPTELREAAMLAAIMHEERKPKVWTERPFYSQQTGWMDEPAIRERKR